MTNQQALNTIYQVARLAPVSASDHEQVVKATNLLQELIVESEDAKVEDKKKK